jgi:hypothetical protein
MIRRPRRKLFIGLLILPLVAVLVAEFRNESNLQASIQNKCTKTDDEDPSNWSRPTSGQVKNIALTNQGEFVDRCQFTDVLDELIWDGPFPPRLNINNSISRPKLVVLFVHGWMHDGSENDPNHKRFSKLVADLAATQEKQVLGVYVTWNASTGNAILDYFSFWSRQRIADRITQSAVLTKIVGAIGSTRGISRKQDNFIAIGHSFGARMLFAAVNAPLIQDVTKAFPVAHSDVYRTFKGPADAIVLINPAFEAARYTTLNSFMRNEEVFSQRQPPLMITVSTNNDSATKLFFPVGQLFGLSFDKRAVTTLGNYDRYYTHILFDPKVKGTKCVATDPFNLTEDYFTSGLCLRRESNWHRLSDEDAKFDPNHWSDVCPNRQMFNPFLVVHTTKDIIDNHGGFWDEDKPAFFNWLFDVLKALDLRNDRAGATELKPSRTTTATASPELFDPCHDLWPER